MNESARNDDGEDIEDIDKVSDKWSVKTCKFNTHDALMEFWDMGFRDMES